MKTINPQKQPVRVTNLEKYRFTFGKYKGYTAQYVLENEPTYILWLHDNRVILFDEELVDAIEYDVREQEDLYWPLDD